MPSNSLVELKDVNVKAGDSDAGSSLPFFSNNTPISDKKFLEELPENLVIKTLGKEKKYKLSQSLIKNWIKVRAGTSCALKFQVISIEKFLETTTSPAQWAGQRFEYELTGAFNFYGKVPPKMTTSTGKDSAEQSRIGRNVVMAKAAFHREGIDLKEYQINQSFQVKGIDGRFDLIKVDDEKKTIHLIDIKYSGTKGEKAKYNPYGFYPETMHSNYTHGFQVAHYVLLSRLKYPGYTVSFSFFVFYSGNNHEGKYDIFHMNAGEDYLNRYKNLVLATFSQIQENLNNAPLPARALFEECQACPYSICQAKALHPTPYYIDLR